MDVECVERLCEASIEAMYSTYEIPDNVYGKNLMLMLYFMSYRCCRRLVCVGFFVFVSLLF